MSFLLSANDVNILEMRVSASMLSGITWYPFIETQGSDGTEYTLAEEYLTATFVNIGGNPFVEWGQLYYDLDTNVIDVTALDDSAVFVISALSVLEEGGEPATASAVYLLPYYITQQQITANQLSATLSAYYIQVSTASTLHIPENTELYWEFGPTYNMLSAGFGDDYNIINLATSVSAQERSLSATELTLAYAGLLYDITEYTQLTIVNDKYKLSPLSSMMVFEESYVETILNPRIDITVSESASSYTLLSAVQNTVPVSGDVLISWNVDDTTNVIATTAGSWYELGEYGTANELNPIILSSFDLSQTYIYTLSSFTGEITGTFRPYYAVTETSSLTARINKLDTETNTYRYNLKGLGITNGLLHNISPYQYIAWDCDNTSICNAKYASNGVTPYNFGSISVARNIDDINIEILPVITTLSPNTCSISFHLCSLSGSKINQGIYCTYDFDIHFEEWLSNDVMDPRFRFQYEPDTWNTIFRPTTGSAYYNISNTSILPQGSIGQLLFTFDNTVCSVPFDLRTAAAPSGVTHEFNTTHGTICSISLMVCASAVGFDDFVIREANAKQIIFTDIPVASGFIAYPEWHWNGTLWEHVVDSYEHNKGDILLPDIPLSAYGLCHTENIFLSSDQDGMEYYQWIITDENDSYYSNTTIVEEPTAWISFKTVKETSRAGISAALFTGLLSAGMHPLYYDTPVGIKFNNFSSVYDPITSEHKKVLDTYGTGELGINATILSISHNQLPAPNYLIVSGSYTQPNETTPFGLNINSYYFDLSSEFWHIRENANNFVSDLASKSMYIKTDDDGRSYLGVPKNETTKILLIPGFEYSLQLKSAHPSATDWCFNNIIYNGDSLSQEITAYPMNPLVYTPNRFMITGSNIKFENLVPAFSAVSGFVWSDRDSYFFTNTNNPYITSYDYTSINDLSLRTYYDFNGVTTYNSTTFNDIVNIIDSYRAYDTDVTRIHGSTRMEFPHSLDDCYMPPNEWTIKDTFNNAIIKLSENLNYLENQSKLYDIPPTTYIGWFGSLYYNNSAIRTRWFTNTPSNSYMYKNPGNALDINVFKSCYVKDNTMYVSKGTTVEILSGNFWATKISEKQYKSMGDDFINIKTIDLDSTNRIYLLDTYDPDNLTAGSKNRIIVYDYNETTRQWNLLYEWGGLGGITARNKFNNPSDLHIDSYDILWIADTENKCIKKFTKTGSWLATLTSEYFTDIEKPLSITSDDYNNFYVLTTSKIIKFNENNINVFDIDIGATRIKKCKDNGFIYIVYNDKIIKYNVNGASAGSIAENDFADYTKQYIDTYHDEYRNLYILNNNHILKYSDQLSIISLKLDTVSNMWPLESLLVSKDENIQDWVVNRCYQRLWDNIEIFRRSLIGKFGYQTYQNVTETTYTTAIQPPEGFDYCNYDWLYDYGRTITENTVFEYDKPVVVSFSIDEYIPLPHQKNTIYIGLNEINAMGVYNRVIAKLYENLATILNMIDD
jgi:hypothetical protein